MSFTLTNVRIWDGRAAGIDAGMDAIVVEDREIIHIGSSEDLASRHSTDMGGVYVVPGLIDAHVHLCLNPDIRSATDQGQESEAELLAQMAERAEQMVNAGITSARDLGGGRWLELTIRDRINQDRLPGPRLLCAGQPVTSPGGHCHFWGGEASNADEAIKVIERQLAKEVDLIKIMATGGSLTPGSRPVDPQFDAATLTEIVAEAARHGLHVAAHCHGTEGISNAAEAGVTTIEHCSWVSEAGWGQGYDADVAEILARRDVRVSPTINSGWKRRIGSGDYEGLIQHNFERLRSAGVGLIASTDAGIPNVFHHDLPSALPVFAHFAGLEPVEALRAATSDCADAIGLGSVTGRLEPGYSADFILFEQNPLEDLDILKSPLEVWVRGKRLNRST